MVVQGQAQVVVISDYNEATNIWKVSRRDQSGSRTQRSDTFNSQSDIDFETANITPITSLTAAISLEGIGISVIDKRLREMVYASFRGIDLTFEETQLQREYGLIVRWIQLDNQLDGALFPVLFGPTDLPADPKEIEIRPNLQIQANIVKDDRKLRPVCAKDDQLDDAVRTYIQDTVWFTSNTPPSLCRKCLWRWTSLSSLLWWGSPSSRAPRGKKNLQSPNLFFATVHSPTY